MKEFLLLMAPLATVILLPGLPRPVQADVVLCRAADRLILTCQMFAGAAGRLTFLRIKRSWE